MKTTHILRTGLLLCGLLLCATSVVAQDGLIIPTQAAYGSDSRLCDATAAVNEQCGGKPSCTIAASNGLCGDPDYGVVKKLKVIYRCSRDGEDIVAEATEHASPVTLSCSGLRIQAVAYGAEGRFCNATPAFVSACNGQSSCSVPASNSLCGDPNYGVVKAAQITYQCGAEQHFATVAERDTANLDC